MSSSADSARDIEPWQLYVKAAEHVINPVPDGYLVHEPAGERVHLLNEAASLVFEMCDGQHTVEEIEVLYEKAFANNQPSRDLVRQCLRQLLDQSLIEPCTPPSSAP